MRRLIPGKSIYLREARMEDAAELVRLRNQEKCQGGLSATSPEIDRQRDWLAAYAGRSAAGTERYYMICSLENHRVLGAFRILDVVGGSFRLGSWVIDAGAPLNVAIQTVLLAYDEMFVQGSSMECRFEVQLGNESLLRFHPKLGAKIEREDAHEVFFVTTRADYLAARPRYQRWLTGPTQEASPSQIEMELRVKSAIDDSTGIDG